MSVIWFWAMPLLAILVSGTLLLILRGRRQKRKYQAVKLSAELGALFGMTTVAEREYVREFGAKHYTGQGSLVDLGCWLGSFTVPLATGLAENRKVPNKKGRIHSYDLFQWEDWMNKAVKSTALEGRYREGDNFVEAFHEQITPVADMVIVHAGDLNAQRWNPGEPVEYLIVDAMKNWDLTNAILRNFFPALRPELSFVHHQDFAHYYTSWIHLLMYRFRHYFEPVTYVPVGSFVFRYKTQVPPELLERSYSFDDFSEQEIEEAFSYSLSLVPEAGKLQVQAARIMTSVHRGDWTRARMELAHLRAAGVPIEKELAVVARLVSDEGTLQNNSG